VAVFRSCGFIIIMKIIILVCNNYKTVVIIQIYVRHRVLVVTSEIFVYPVYFACTLHLGLGLPRFLLGKRF